MTEDTLESRRMHYNLFGKIGGELPYPSQEFADFLLQTRTLLNTRDVTQNEKSAEDMLIVLESRGHIFIGGYDKLKQLLIDANLTKVLKFVVKEEEAIKKQLELEKHVAESTNPVKNAPNPPSNGPDDASDNGSPPGYIS